MRFKVATCEGYATAMGGHRSAGSGVTAHVLDTWYAHRVVKLFRSEDYPTRRAEYARYGAVRDAQHWAETMNAAEELDDDAARAGASR